MTNKKQLEQVLELLYGNAEELQKSLEAITKELAKVNAEIKEVQGDIEKATKAEAEAEATVIVDNFTPTEKQIKLQESLSKAMDKVEKIANTKAKNYKKLDKKISEALVIVPEAITDYSGVKFNCNWREWDEQKTPFTEQRMRYANGSGQDAYWVLVEVDYALDAVRGSHKKLAEAQQIVSNWETKLAKEVAKVKGAISAPKVLRDFLDNWEQLSIAWMQKNTDMELSRIKKMVADEKTGKLYWLNESVKGYVGTITDASCLSVSPKGDLLGNIHGTKGSCHIQSVMAGGWNIQRFHFRTLIHAL